MFAEEKSVTVSSTLIYSGVQKHYIIHSVTTHTFITVAYLLFYFVIF